MLITPETESTTTPGNTTCSPRTRYQSMSIDQPTTLATSASPEPRLAKRVFNYLFEKRLNLSEIALNTVRNAN